MVVDWRVCDTCNHVMHLQGKVYRCPRCGRIIEAKEVNCEK